MPRAVKQRARNRRPGRQVWRGGVSKKLVSWAPWAGARVVAVRLPALNSPEVRTDLTGSRTACGDQIASENWEVQRSMGFLGYSRYVAGSFVTPWLNPSLACEMHFFRGRGVCPLLGSPTMV